MVGGVAVSNEKHFADAAVLAREVNQRIRQIGGSLTEPGEDPSEELTFFCECGCLDPVDLTLAAFDARGALLTGHSRPEGEA